jgi:hypothetical protein
MLRRGPSIALRAGHNILGQRRSPGANCRGPSNLQPIAQDKEVFSEILRLIVAARQRAFHAVNTELKAGRTAFAILKLMDKERYEAMEARRATL